MTQPPTPDVLPPVPDANLPPWVLAYANYKGRAVELVDCIKGMEAEFGLSLNLPRRYEVTRGRHALGHRGPALLFTNDYTEALAEYERQAELLRRGED
jgi:hypothetical protein